MNSGVDVFYWDACIFYEFIRDEPVQHLKKLAVQEFLLDNVQKRNRICTSVFTHLEVFPKKVTAEQDALYWGKFNSPYFFDIEISSPIIQLARELREFYYVEPVGDAHAKVMSSGDSIHLATAIIHEVTEFHTRDGKTKGGNVPLIGLSENSPGGKLCGKYDLKIVNPEAVQTEMFVARDEPRRPDQ